MNYFWRGRESIEKIEFVTEKKNMAKLTKERLNRNQAIGWKVNKKKRTEKKDKCKKNTFFVLKTAVDVSAFRPALHIRDIFFCAYESMGVCLPFTP